MAGEEREGEGVGRRKRKGGRKQPWLEGTDCFYLKLVTELGFVNKRSMPFARQQWRQNLHRKDSST